MSVIDEFQEFDLESALKQRSTTDPKERNRCPECLGVNIEEKNGHGQEHSQRKDGDYRCQRPCCGHHFDDPVTGINPQTADDQEDNEE